MFQLLLNSARTASRAPLFLTLTHQRVGWGWARSWDATQLGQLTPTDQRDIPDHKTSALSNRSWGKKEQGRGSPWRGQTLQCPSSLLLASQQLHLKGPHQHPPSHQPAAGLSGSQEERTSQGTSKPFACCWPITCRDRGDLPRNSQAMCLLLPYQHLWQK